MRNRRNREPTVEEIMGYVALQVETRCIRYVRRDGNRLIFTEIERPNKSYSITFDVEGNMNIEDYEVME